MYVRDSYYKHINVIECLKFSLNIFKIDNPKAKMLIINILIESKKGSLLFASGKSSIIGY